MTDDDELVEAIDRRIRRERERRRVDASFRLVAGLFALFCAAAAAGLLLWAAATQ